MHNFYNMLIFYGLTADRHAGVGYIVLPRIFLILNLRTCSGPPGVLFYHGFLFYLYFL